MKRTILAAAAVAAAALAAVAAALVGPGPGNGTASSHREAPLISEDPVADNTDVYAFVSPDKPDTVTILANYIPLEEPAGGPNFNGFGDDVLYELKVDNTGDGDEDISYQFRFRTETRNPNTFLYNTGPIDTLSDTDWNRPQFYSVTRVDKRGGGIIGGGSRTTLAQNVPTPPVAIGPRSTPNYGSLMGAAIRTLPGGGKVYAGQIDDPFYVDLGSVFDLAGLRPFNPAHAIPLPAAPGVDGVGGFNTHTIALQVPIAQLTKDKAVPTGPNDPDAVLGIYATREPPARASARQGRPAAQDRRLRAGLAAGEPARERGRDPARREGPLERVRSVGRRGLRRQVPRSRGDPARERSLQRARRRARDESRRPRRDPAHGRRPAGCRRADQPQLHRLDQGRPDPPEHGHRPDRAGRQPGTGSACSRATSPASRTDGVSRTTSPTSSCAPSHAATARSSARSSRRSASAAATPIGRRTTCSATASTRTTGPFHVGFPYAGEPHQGYEHVHHSSVGGP